jgi:hypothetical protein
LEPEGENGSMTFGHEFKRKPTMKNIEAALREYWSIEREY